MLRQFVLSLLAVLAGLSVASIAQAQTDSGGADTPQPKLDSSPSLDVSLDAPRPIVPPTASLPTRPPAEPRVFEGTRLRWYGYQIIAVDIAALVTSAAAHSGYGGFVYLTGGPFVHLLHGNYAEAVGSAGLRLGLPIAGFHLGLLAPADSGLEQMGIMLRGAMLGTLSAVVIDSAIAFKRVPVEADRLAVTPVVGGSSEGAVVGLAGAF